MTNSGYRTPQVAEDGEQQRPPAPPRRPRSYWRWIEHLLALVGLFWILAVATPFASWLFSSLDRQDKLERADYILCLGGNPSRVLESVRLLRDGYAPVMVVSNHENAATMMRDLAVEWGAPPERVIVDDQAWKTLDHPRTIAQRTGLNPEKDSCIIVTSYTHMARSKACFERAGYRHLILREPRWERDFRGQYGSWQSRFLQLPQLLYECAAWTEYRLRGAA